LFLVADGQLNIGTRYHVQGLAKVAPSTFWLDPFRWDSLQASEAVSTLTRFRVSMPAPWVMTFFAFCSGLVANQGATLQDLSSQLLVPANVLYTTTLPASKQRAYGVCGVRHVDGLGTQASHNVDRVRYISRQLHPSIPSILSLSCNRKWNRQSRSWKRLTTITISRHSTSINHLKPVTKMGLLGKSNKTAVSSVGPELQAVRL
jgi:hypothetical protein